MADSESARKIIEENMYMVLATASLKGEPWVSPVFFAYDDVYNFYWVSNKQSHHSQLLEQNPLVAISIYDSRAPEGEGDGVYIKANVFILRTELEVEKGIYIFNSRATMDDFKIKQPTEVAGTGVWRIYRAEPYEITKLGKGTFVNGQYTDQRIAVKLL